MQKKISRRQFIRNSGIAMAAGLTLPSFINAPLFAGDAPVDIAVIKGEHEKALQRAFELLGGISKFIKQDDVVLLKPNAAFPNPPEQGSTTAPGLVRAMILMAQKAGAKKVIVADNTMNDSDLCFERCGMKKAVEGLEGVNLIALSDENNYIEITVPNGKALKTVKIPKLLGRANVIINMPCAKSHASAQVSFGIKNLMGLIWDRKYFHAGTDLHTAIAELATVIKPHLTIVDATRALLTNGPTGPGKIQEMNTIIMGVDMLAVDSYATSMATWNNRSITPSSVKYLAHAAELGIGQLDTSKLHIVKETV